ncbi:MAG TPA: hypothetical protein VM889_01645 [Candidatus Thermoplasmatota archaeon]|nr:hypothetical protein [Candidatus Thermoplasmatota archaeon]
MLRRHATLARRLRPLHRLFQAGLGILASQHPAVVDACGGRVAWGGLWNVKEGGVAFVGPRATYAVVPTLEGAWCVGRAGAPVVRAVDGVLDAMFHTAAGVLESAKPGREGNEIARSFFYLQRGIDEPEFVAQYVALAHARVRPEPLVELFGLGGR